MSSVSHGKELDKVNKALDTFFSNRFAVPDAIAAYWAGRWSQYQEPFFEMCVSYIRRVAENEAPLEYPMSEYREVARRMTEAGGM